MASREFKVKAGFLYNFTQFVEWPATAFENPESPFIFGILGTDPFGTYLDSILAGEKVAGHSITVQRFQAAKEIQHCQILFISLPHPDSTDLAEMKKHSVLTVSDAEGFMKLGGMIRFMQNNKIRLQINPAAIKTAQLNISSKLLRVAEIYTDSK